MIYLPVFGKDSVPHSSSRLLGFCSTMVLWTIFFIVMILIGSKKEPKVKYETVQIQLSPYDHYVPNIPEDFLGGNLASGEVEQQATSESAPAAIEQSVPVPAPSPVPAKPKNTPAPKPAQAKTTTTKSQAKTNNSSNSSAPSMQSYSNSVEDAFANQTNQTVTKKAPVWDESLFADSSNASTNSSKGQAGVVSQDNTYSGSAANSTTSYNQTQTSSSSNSSSSSASQNSQVTQGTANALQSLQNATAQAVSSDRGTEARTSMRTTQSGDGKNMVQMSDGSTRALLQPSTIAINLSDDAQRAIIDNCEVTIRFVVNENGYVTGTISITPESSLPQIVKNEIRNQISRWRFESADNTSRGEFNLKLIKK